MCNVRRAVAEGCQPLPWHVVRVAVCDKFRVDCALHVRGILMACRDVSFACRRLHTKCHGDALSANVAVNQIASGGTEVQLYQGDCTGITRIAVPNATQDPGGGGCSPLFLLDQVRAEKMQ
jgi:hypothetical protein